MIRNRKSKGFTIVELIIVIAVIGVLAAILIPTFANVIDKANAKSALSDARNALTTMISDEEGVGNNNSLKDSLFVVHKASKLFMFNYDYDAGQLVACAAEYPCNINKNSATYESDLQSAIVVILDDLISRGEFIGSLYVDTTTGVATETAKNVKIFSGMLNTPESATDPYYSKLVPKSVLLDNKTTIINQYGLSEEAILVNSTIEFYSVMQYMRASYTNENIVANVAVRSDENITLNTNIKLGCDIYLGGCNWISVGTSSKPFTGVLDGNGHTIYDLHSTVNATVLYELQDSLGNPIESVPQTSVSLFGYTAARVMDNACIKSLTICNAYSTDEGIAAVAPLAQYGYELDVLDVNVRGNLHSYSDVLGLCRYSFKSSFRNCNIYADLKSHDSTETTAVMMGACVGVSRDTRFENIYFNGEIRSEDTDRELRCGMLASHIEGEYINAYKSITIGPDVEFYGYAASVDDAGFAGKSNADDTTATRNNVRVTYNLGDYDFVPSFGHGGQYAYELPGCILTNPSYTKLFGKFVTGELYCLDSALTNIYTR